MTDLQVWAPRAQQVEVETGGERHPMYRRPDGWWHASILTLTAGEDYAYVLDGRDPLPDPRSEWQPYGVHGPSRLVDHAAFGWTDDRWHGTPLRGRVVYELHVGTFSPEGTFDGVIDHLDHLADLGVDLVELLPVNAFPGRWGWGYEGVDLYAVQASYGGPEGLKRLVDACHARGIGVIMDVVYNHFGPSGNYLPQFGPYLTDKHQTPWGSAVNYDDAGSDEVRRFVLDNAAMWLRDYHCDGLRLDAVHAIIDTSAIHLLSELSAEVGALSAQLGRTLFLIAESDLNDPRVVTPREANGLGMDAQWSDDFHHALHTVLTGEHEGYYGDFGSLDDLAVALTEGYVHGGRFSQHRDRRHGAPYRGLSGHRLLGYLQDHDQVGNRAAGARISTQLSAGLLQVGAALVLTSPFTPLLWMGEEWGARTPWQFFTDHDDVDLGRAITDGRRQEFVAFGWDPSDVPDPQDPATFERSRLDWAELDKDKDAEHSIFAFYRRLIRLRRDLPDLTDPDLDAVTVAYDDDKRWIAVRRGSVAILANLAAGEQRLPTPAPVVDVVLASAEGFMFDADGVTLPAESVAIARLSGPAAM
ncbi:MAG: maltooligosyltrehalose trehalohydrolase [Frankiales bacterium]|jgi:maltooligosyltrehalose trehalohydrolase|nr:maltooligosyltrehalose trehalohydrolase [Frankiales bacterium]